MISITPYSWVKALLSKNLSVKEGGQMVWWSQFQYGHHFWYPVVLDICTQTHYGANRFLINNTDSPTLNSGCVMLLCCTHKKHLRRNLQWWWGINGSVVFLSSHRHIKNFVGENCVHLLSSSTAHSPNFLFKNWNKSDMWVNKSCAKAVNFDKLLKVCAERGDSLCFRNGKRAEGRN